MKILSRTVGPMRENTYLVVDEETGDAVLVDPGAESEVVLEMLERSGAHLSAVWLTHAHLDHIGAINGVRARHAVPVHLHAADRPVYEAQSIFAEAWGIPFDQPEPADAEIDPGATLRVGNLEFAVLHAPGHSPGHVMLLGNGVLIGGDVLFAGSIGRTDIPLSDPAAMAETLDLVKSLPPETIVYPGHGEATTIGDELRENPFLNGTVNVKRNSN